MSRDETMCKEPERFDPDRFLDPGVPPLPAFGWGRRKCPGVHFGQASLFITVASLLAMFNFSKKRDSNGNYIEPVIEDAPNSIILSRRGVVHPPSPLSLPIIGNVLSLPSGPEYIAYMKLGKKLNSDIIYLDLLGHDIVVLNSPQAALELLDKRSSIYSDRFCPLIYQDKSLFDWSTSPPFLGYNDVWRHHRRMMNKWLNTREVSQFYKMQEGRARSLLQRLFVISAEEQPFDSVKNEFYFAMGSSIFQMAYGYTVQGHADPYFRAAHEVDDHASQAAMITNFYVNIFPFLNNIPEWVPGTGWKRTVRKWREQKAYALNAPFRWTQNQVAQGTNEASIISDLLQSDDLMLGLSREERDHRLKELAHVLYSGGTDTTSSLLLSFVAAMVLNPEIQTQAQNEIDLILGTGVLPTMLDRERLPYVNRLILEFMRWRPPLTIGVPHRCFQDDVYRGYNITKGTIMIGNIWAMGRDEKLYQDPETFNPDRFLDPEVPSVPVFGWGRDIVYLNLFGHEIIVLNSSEAASDLLEKRSALYSDRFCPLMLKDKELLDWSTAPTILGYNDTWRHHRRMMNKWLNVREVSQFYKQQEHQAHTLLQRLLKISAEAHPFDKVRDEFFFAVGSSIFRATYGYTPQEKSDPFLKAAQETIDRGSEAVMVTNFFVNIIPALKFVPEWFPGAGWKRIIREWKKQKEYAQTAPYQWTQSQVSQGINKPSILSTLLQDHDLVSGLSPEEKEDRLKQLAFILYSAATDTTATLLVSFVAAMVLNPDIQLQAQQEIDLVLGSGVLPHISDRERLPYVNRLIMELLRWRPVAPIAIPHQCFQDDVYRGYHIKKGTIVMGNLWAMSRDERYYQDPESFNPDRFLDPKVPPLSAFGWGRRRTHNNRICPGIHFGEASLFITIASMLATFTFTKKRTPDGNYIEPVIEDAPNSLVLGLKAFEFEFAPRSEMHYRTIEETI
ncbi:unnamed protein product [Rhizoctonia solani]|uniref:O-methylsterigmatocystin oxidoreductase n=1 Tax=Rhizoctonia solani TaxID=456999 RepID=A0A8H3DYA1_9AGAM|nr:unnamed protein product [Rhizoctonia solani]